ncbi:MAG: type II toxin-antitoxin system HicB family antitoxin [Chloroflexi bacterium]|nr:type II toxin-antitoxin system HicB family antitoxin [Chloroflexota bacterium]
MTTTDSSIEQQVQELLKRPYRKVIRGDTEEGFLAEAPELPHCFTAGETEEEALEMLRDAMAGWFESALAHGDPIPEPEPPGATRYSGYITVRMPPSLHRHLAEQARSEGVSLNQWAVTLLARGLG